jgi:hypothetical protein
MTHLVILLTVIVWASNTIDYGSEKPTVVQHHLQQAVPREHPVHVLAVSRAPAALQAHPAAVHTGVNNSSNSLLFDLPANQAAPDLNAENGSQVTSTAVGGPSFDAFHWIINSTSSSLRVYRKAESQDKEGSLLMLMASSKHRAIPGLSIDTAVLLQSSSNSAVSMSCQWSHSQKGNKKYLNCNDVGYHVYTVASILFKVRASWPLSLLLCLILASFTPTSWVNPVSYEILPCIVLNMLLCCRVSQWTLQVVPLLIMTGRREHNLVQDTTYIKNTRGVRSIPVNQHVKAGGSLPERLTVTAPSCVSSTFSSLPIDNRSASQAQMTLVNSCNKAGDPFSCKGGMTVVDSPSVSRSPPTFNVGLRSTPSFNVDFLLGVHPCLCHHAMVSHPSIYGNHT